jgi:hypothetical protein
LLLRHVRLLVRIAGNLDWVSVSIVGRLSARRRRWTNIGWPVTIGGTVSISRVVRVSVRISTVESETEPDPAAIISAAIAGVANIASTTRIPTSAGERLSARESSGCESATSA